MKNVLLVGGTGAIGQYLSPFLVKEGFTVYITSRSERKSNDKNVIYLQGNGKDLAWLEKLSADYKFISIVDFMMYSSDEFKERYEKLLTLSKQYFFLSSYRALADETAYITEESPRKLDVLDKYPEFSADTYGIRKAEEEELLHNASTQNWTILRPSMTFSRGRFQFGASDNNDVLRTTRGGGIILSDQMINQSTTLVYGKDVALMISKLVDNQRAIGQVFNVVTSESHTWQEVSDIYHKVFGLKLKTVLPNQDYVALTKLEGAMIDRVLSRKFDNSKLLDVTGLKESDFHSLADGLTEAWHETDFERFFMARRNWEYEAKVDFLTDTRQNLDRVSLRSKIIYFDTLAKLGKVDDFYVRESNGYWQASQLDNHLKLHRTKKDSSGPDNRWISLKIGDSIRLKKGFNYLLSLSISSTIETEFTPFFHVRTGSIQSLDRQKINKDDKNQLKINFKANSDDFTDLAFTATDFIESGDLIIESISIDPE
ncbi:NAD-dependent epimerase/dehydratase family protein [Lactococcus insecticola]|nr:NAD-dependent epimerase/dehydratase family protein [Lactococcus insecticola]